MSSSGSPGLKRVLGRADLVLLFVVAITNLNVVPVIAANGPFTLWLWLLALVCFFWPQGIAVIELARRHPEEGGVYVWTKAAFGDFHGFLSGWCYWTNNIFYVPTVLLYLVGVVVYVFGPQAASLADDKAFAFVVSTVLLWILVWLNARGLGVGKWVNNAGGWAPRWRRWPSWAWARHGSSGMAPRSGHATSCPRASTSTSCRLSA